MYRTVNEVADSLERPSRVSLTILFCANSISGLGNQFTFIAVPWFVLETTGSAAKTGLTGFFTTFPILLMGFFGGTVVDRFGFKRTSVFSDSTSGLIVALIPLLFHTIGLAFWQLLGLVFLRTLLAGPGNIGRQSLIPDLARIGNVGLERTNAISQASGRITSLMGPLLAGALIAIIGTSNLLWLDAGSFFLSAIMIAVAIRSQPVHHVNDHTVPYLTRLRAGFQFLRSDRLLRALLLAVSTTNLLAAPLYIVVFPVYAKARFGKALDLGLMFTSIGIGALIGSITFGVIGHRLPRRATFLGGVLATAMADGLLALNPALPVVIMTLTLVGFAGSPINVLLMTIRQERVPAHVRGRVFGLMQAMNNLTVPLGMVVIGRLLQQVGIRVTLLAIAVSYLPVAVALFKNPAFHEMERPYNDASRRLSPT